MRVLRLCASGHEPIDIAELAAHLVDDLARRAAHGVNAPAHEREHAHHHHLDLAEVDGAQPVPRQHRHLVEDGVEEQEAGECRLGDVAHGVEPVRDGATLISTTPPALSAMGPTLFIESTNTAVHSMLIVARAVPNSPLRWKAGSPLAAPSL